MASVKGGDVFVEKLRVLSKRIGAGGAVQVGFFKGTVNTRTGASIPMVAAIQEYGAPSRGIPPRPFFRTMVKEKSPEWPAAIAALLKRNNYDVEKTLDITGSQISIQLKNSISNLYAPPLSPVTVMLRGMKSHDPDLKVSGKTVGEAAARVKAGLTNYGASTKPLIDTGELLASVTYKTVSE